MEGIDGRGIFGESKKEEIEGGIKYDKNYCKVLAVLGVLGIFFLILSSWISYHAYQAHSIFFFLGSMSMGILGLTLVGVALFCGIGYHREIKKNKEAKKECKR